MQYNVTKIQKVSNKLVLFWNGSQLIRPITIINSIDTRPGVMRLHTDTEIFEFDVYNITEITDGTTTKTYTAMSLTGTDSDAYKVRFQLIFQFLVTNILRGCCCDDPGSVSGGGLIQYLYNSAAPSDGQFAYNISGDGKLRLSFISNYAQDFTNLLHHVPNGAWIWFFSENNQDVYTVFQIANYAAVGTTATWDATIKAGATSFTVNDPFFVVIDNSGVSGSLQGFQDTLDVDPNVDTDNIVDGTGFGFIWNQFKTWLVTATTSIISRVTSGANVSESGNSTTETYIKYTKSGVIIGVWVDANKLRILTTNINTAAAVSGYPLILTSTIDGNSDFNQLDTVGIKDLAVTYAKIQNVSATDRLLGRQTAGAGVVEEIICTAAGRALIDDASASDQRTTLGIKQCIPLSGGNLGGTIAAGATVYFAPTVDATPGATETARCSVIAFSGTAVSFYYQTFATQPATGSLVLTFRRAIGMAAFASTAVVITIAAGSAAGIFSDTVNTATVAAGDRVSIQGVNNASTASASIGSWQIIIEQSY